MDSNSSNAQKSSIVKPSSYLYNINCGNTNLCSADINLKKNLLACGFGNSEIHVFKTEPLQSDQHDASINSASFCLDESLLTNDDDVLNTSLGSSKVLKGHQKSVFGLAFSIPHSLLLSCSEDSNVQAWNTDNFNTVAVYGERNFPVFDISLSNNGEYFATATMDCTANVWSFERSEPLRSFTNHPSSVNNVRFHSNSKYLATTSRNVIRLWALQDGRTLRSFLGHRSRISCIAFSPSGQQLASADEKGHIKIWDLGSGKEIGEIKAHEKSILSIAYNKNSEFIASGGFDKALKVWDVQHSISKNTSSNASEEFEKSNISSDSKLVDSHSTETTLHYVSFTKKHVLLSVASSET